MVIEITWENGDKQKIKNITGGLPLVNDIADATIFKKNIWIHFFNGEKIAIDFTKARFVRLIG